jgi:DSS1/SEM1 family
MSQEEKAAEIKKEETPKDAPPAPLLEALEEDDEFEEFEAEHWSSSHVADATAQKQLWMDNWDDDMDDDFTKNLRAALTKS